MKYTIDNAPLICMMTDSTCYTQTRTMEIKGILWHSTGANNPTLKRYVQPSKSDKNYSQLIATIGKNTESSDWNTSKQQAGLNAWIGKAKNGTVMTVQTMPWNYRPWGCGSGAKGSCNNGWIQFEICEDSLQDKQYFLDAYQEAIELTAYLCQLYNINPMGTVNYNNISIPTILCHADAYRLGVGSNHGDVEHWFKRYGKTMKDVRKEVQLLMNNTPIANNNSQLKVSDLKGKTEAEFIEKVGPLCTADEEKTGVLACVSMAQCILESGWGTTDLALNANNCFGMKTSLSGNSWEGSTWDKKSIYTKRTGEQKKDGTKYTIVADFRKYPSLQDSIADHSAYLTGAMNGKKKRYEGIASEKNYKEAFKIIKNGGYATDLQYVAKLCSIVERYNLTRFNAAATNIQLSSVSTPSTAKTTTNSYMVKVTVDGLNVRKGPGTKYGIVMTIKDRGVYTIVEEKNGWGKLKSGAGWISLNYTEKR